MRTRLSMIFVLGLGLLFAAAQQEPTQEAGDRQAELERAFEQTMSGATLAGSFTTDGAKNQSLQEDRYTISKVTKVGGDRWRFDARVQYGKLDVTVPMILKVKWAGDTPVITLTDLDIPMLGTYTARVLVYRGQYAGTWSAGDHGGKMFGRVIPPKKKRRDL